MEVKVEIKKVLVKDLKYAPYNPRKISDEVFNKLKQSIEEFGYVEPIVVNKRTRHVVGGNQRLKALNDLGIEEVEAVFVDLDDAREKALKDDILPISPLHLFSFMENDEKREEILQVCYRLIDICDEVWIYGDSEGCKREAEYAQRAGKVVRMYG